MKYQLICIVALLLSTITVANAKQQQVISSQTVIQLKDKTGVVDYRCKATKKNSFKYSCVGFRKVPDKKKCRFNMVTFKISKTNEITHISHKNVVLVIGCNISKQKILEMYPRKYFPFNLK